MCFRRVLCHKKADKDIVCYKVMVFDGVNRLSSLLCRTHKSYRPGDKIKAYEKLSLLKSKNVNLIDHKRFLKGEVVHSFKDLKTTMQSVWGSGVAVVECIIPKGEYYWENSADCEYASLSLKISKIMYYSSYGIIKPTV